MGEKCERRGKFQTNMTEPLGFIQHLAWYMPRARSKGRSSQHHAAGSKTRRQSGIYLAATQRRIEASQEPAKTQPHAAAAAPQLAEVFQKVIRPRKRPCLCMFHGSRGRLGSGGGPRAERAGATGRSSSGRAGGRQECGRIWPRRGGAFVLGKLSESRPCSNGRPLARANGFVGA